MSGPALGSGSGLRVASPPFARSPVTTRGIMGDVLLALLPVMLAATLFFGMGALLVVIASIAGCMLAEQTFTPKARRAATLLDRSALLTGMLLGLTLPPSTPMWMAFVGGVAGIGFGKAVWGGLGHNLFNPALVGRAFLQAAFPTVITTWTPHGQGLYNIHTSNFALPFTQAPVDAVTAATPLGLAKFQGQLTPLMDLVVGSTPGSIGETSAALILLGGLWMLARRSMDWRIPLSIILTVVIFSSVAHLVDASLPGPWFMVTSGGLLMGAVFMATDPVTSPMDPRATWVYGVGIGALVVLIRYWGGLPEGVMYAILLMNAATPLLNKAFQPTPFGRRLRRGA